MHINIYILTTNGPQPVLDFRQGELKLVNNPWIIHAQILPVLYAPVLDVTQKMESSGGLERWNWGVRSSHTLIFLKNLTYRQRNRSERKRTGCQIVAAIWEVEQPCLSFSNFLIFCTLMGEKAHLVFCPALPPLLHLFPPSLSSTQHSLHLAPLRNVGRVTCLGRPRGQRSTDSPYTVMGRVFKAGRRMKIWQQKLLYRFWII